MKTKEMAIEDYQEEFARLRSEVTLYRSMFESSHVAQVVIDPDFKIVDLNDAFCTIVNYPREKLRGMDFRDFKGKQMLKYLFDEGLGLADAIKLKKSGTAHAAWEASNGTHIVDRMIIPFFNEKGDLRDVYIIYNEVTELTNRLEEAHLYRSMFETSHVAQVIIDTGYKIVDLNQAFCTITAYPREKLLGMDFRDIKGKKMLEYLYDQGQGLADALELKKPVTARAAFIAANGTHMVNRSIIPFLDDKGQVKDVYIIYNEVTEIENKMAEVERLQKQSEAIVQQNPMPILLWDKDLKVIASNKAFLDLTGFSKEQAERLTITDFKYNAQSGQSVADTMKTGLASRGEAAIQFPSGERVVERYNIPLVDAKGALVNILTVYNNITEQKRAIKDIVGVSTEAERGNLSARTKEDNYTGDFFEIAHGVNRTLDAVIGPLNVAAEYVDRISKGDIPPKIKETYYGDFNEIKNNLNLCIDAVNLLIEDTGMLTKATVEGRLDARADTSRHQGDFAKVIKGVNDTLDAVIGPLNVAAEYVDRISKGDIPPRITDNYRGDFNEIKNNLNQCIDAVNLLVEDMQKLSGAAVEGRLDARADTSRHQGDFAKVIKGVNATLDAVIGPLNVAAEYVDRISKGDLPPRITDNYRGDFNEIKNNLNQCIDAVNLLVEDMHAASTAAVEGRLNARTDSSRHQGDFAKVIKGVNDTLDAVIGPVHEAMRLSDELARCNFSARFDDRIAVAGDFIAFKSALNNLGLRVEGAIKEIGRVAASYASGDFSTGINPELNIQGDLVRLKESLDRIGVAVSRSLAVVNIKMNDLSTEAAQASAGVSDVSRGAEMITKNAEDTKLNAERSDQGITQVLRTMEDLTKTVSEVSSNAEAVAVLSNKANVLAKEGITYAGRAESGMGSITKTSKEVDALIAEIKLQMDEIGKIVGIISDLANQTNLLALNAAIEAARAGEAGRGFAVVASEVKSLAQGSRQSAQNIGDMITGLQKKSQDAANAMAHAGVAVKEGNAALVDTLRIFNELTGSVEDISKKMVSVAGATETQAASFEEITASVNEMSGLVRQTAKDALNSSTTSEEALSVVHNITQVIKEINGAIATINTEMGKFKLKS
ncbi:MAG: methyl-accepting chemotaxis protein [Methanomicrobiales archaeon]|nr:methyl-accepting chemotaxis protein [Methanomicrobiales archaeon]